MIRASLLALALLLAAGPAAAQGLSARDTAAVGPKGSYSVGVFNPLRYALSDGFELQAHPLLFFVSPNLLARVDHGALAGFRFAGEYGVSVPTPAMRLSQGYLFPSWDKSDGQIGWFVVPRAGLVASRGVRAADVLTLRLEGAAGIPLTRNDAKPIESVAPLAVLFAPALTGWRARLGAVYDASLSPSWRLRGYADLWLHGRQPSLYTVDAGLGLDFAVGRSSRVTFGVMWWNADEHEIDPATHERVRSNLFVPTLDFIWAG
ncbi:MAG: hypothetical protein ACOX6T_27365 [Myxococcales bacterium]|jgi:hypothetical protein